MSNKIKDGGRAFPSTRESRVEGLLVKTHFPGMTLRDYFAASALQGEIGYSGVEGVVPELTASRCYEMADAMIAEREKEKS